MFLGVFGHKHSRHSVFFPCKCKAGLKTKCHKNLYSQLIDLFTKGEHANTKKRYSIKQLFKHDFILVVLALEELYDARSKRQSNQITLYRSFEQCYLEGKYC